jgi:hypothetical protein
MRVDRFGKIERLRFGTDEVTQSKPMQSGVMYIYVKQETIGAHTLDVPQAVNFLCCFTPLTNYDVRETGDGPVLVPKPHEESKQRPMWEYHETGTIVPSIRYMGGCRAHFNVKDCRVEFCPDSGRT